MGLWGPVGLEKPVDSITKAYFPDDQIRGRTQFCEESGSAGLRPRSKNAQKTEDNSLFDSKKAVFWAKMDDLRATPAQ